MKIRRLVLPVLMMVLLVVLASTAFAELDLTAKKWTGSFKLSGNKFNSKPMPATMQFRPDKTFEMSLAKEVDVKGIYSFDGTNVTIRATEGSGALEGVELTDTILNALTGTVPITNEKGSYKMVVKHTQISYNVTGTLTLARSEIKATSITLVLPQDGNKKLIIGPNQPEYRIGYTLKPANSDAVVKFKSSSKSVATVSNSGVVTPVSAGKTGSKTVTITAYTNSGKKKTVKLTIEDPTIARSISLNVPSKYSMMVGDTFELLPTRSPATATTKVTYSSSVPGIATVNDKGIITAVATSAKKSGKKYTSTVITATCNGYKKKVTVSVLNETSKQAMMIFDGTGGANLLLPSISMAKGDRRSLVAHVLPSNTLSSATWSSSNKKVATIDKTTGEVVGVKAGTAKITGKVGKVTATINLTVSK